MQKNPETKKKFDYKYLLYCLIFILVISSYKIYNYYKYLTFMRNIKSIKYTPTFYLDNHRRMMLYDYYQKDYYKEKINKLLNKKDSDETTCNVQSIILFGLSIFVIDNDLQEIVKSYLSSDSKNKFKAALDTLRIWKQNNMIHDKNYLISIREIIKNSDYSEKWGNNLTDLDKIVIAEMITYLLKDTDEIAD